MSLITAAALIDALIGAGIGVGMDRLADAAPAALTDAVTELRKLEQKERLVRMTAIVEDAVAIAARESKDQTDEQNRKLNAVIEHGPFMAEATALLLLGGRPDVERVRQHLLPLVPEAEWPEQRRVVLRYLQALQTRLDQDSHWGPVLRSFSFEASLAGIDRNTLALGEQLATLQTTVADLPNRTADAVAKRFDLLDLSELEKAYLRGVYRECTNVPLAGDAPPDTPDRKPRLQRIYVDLETRTQPTIDQVFDRLAIPAQGRSALLARWRKLTKGREMPENVQLSAPFMISWLSRVDRRDEKAVAKAVEAVGMDLDKARQALDPLAALEVLAIHRQSVLLGDPGSGKSTLTRRIAGNLAAGGLETDDSVEQAWAAQLQAHFGRWLLPVRVVLSTWAQHLAADATGCADDLVCECVRLISAKSGKLDGSRQTERFLERLTADPPTALLLLDGLDEVADPAKRKVILAAVRDFCGSYADVPLVVTCRVRPYTSGQHYKLPLPDFTLAKLTRPAMDDFIQRWHGELTWAGIYTSDASDQAKTRLLNALDDPARKELREMAGTPLLLTMMARVNYGKGLPEGRAELYEAYVKQLLYEWEKGKQDDQGQPTRLDQILQDGGVSKASLNRALNQLAYTVHGQDGERDTVDIPDHAVRKAIEAIHPGEDDQKAAWAVNLLRLIDDRSGLIHAAEQGSLYRFSHRTFQEYLAARWLATGTTDEVLRKFREKLDAEQWREALFLALGYQISVLEQYDSALAIFEELLPDGVANPSDQRRTLLLGEAYTGLLGPQRARSASQQRLAQRVIQAMPDRLTQLMQHVSAPPKDRLAAGLLLSDLGETPPGLDDFVLLPANDHLDYPIKMGRYPVINAQFRRFVDAGGYAEDRPWWTAEAVKDIERWPENRNWRSGPRYWNDDRFNHATQPVVGISWYEAVAYCHWLSQERGEEIRLPTQAEWERAARSSHGGDYPWGGEFDPARANTDESDPGRTSPVHMYPDGCTPDGVWDLAGNVAEWISDQPGVVKGGAWYWSSAQAKASARVDRGPLNRDGAFGFRVVAVVVPHLS